MNPDVTLNDFTEFFGKTKEELLSGYITGEDNTVKRLIYDRIKPDNDEKARKQYSEFEYAAMRLGGIREGFFTDLENQAKWRDSDRENGSKKGGDDPTGSDLLYNIALTRIPKTSAILDYGCGHGIYPIVLWFMGFKNITLVDVDNVYFQFLEFLCKKYGLNGLKFVKVVGELANLNDVCRDGYDYVICTEVLEHCWEPINILRHIVNHMKKDGLIFIGDFYDDCQGTDPSHLKRNFRYQKDELKFKDYSDTGIEPILRDRNGVMKVWKRV